VSTAGTGPGLRWACSRACRGPLYGGSDAHKWLEALEWAHGRARSGIDDLVLVPGAGLRDVASEHFGGSRLIEPTAGVPCPGTERRGLCPSEPTGPGPIETFSMPAVPYYAWAYREVGAIGAWVHGCRRSAEARWRDAP